MSDRNAGNAWRKVKLIEVCQQITVGHVGSMKEEYLDQGVPFLRSQNVRPFRFDSSGLCHISPAFHEKLKKSSLTPGDVVVTRTGANTGQCCVIPDTLHQANCADLVIFRPSVHINPHFLMYLLNSSWGRATISGGVVGAAQHHFNIGVAKEILVRLPAITTQRKIAFILSAYDDLIESNTRRIAILEEMAQAIYREWFINFRFPGHENVKLVDSPLGQIPEEWEWKNLSDMGFIGRGKSRHRPRNAPELYGGPYPLFQTGDVKAANTFLWKHSQTYSEAGLAQSKLWEPGTLCITIAANIADTAILSKTACFPDSVVGFVSNPDEDCVYFVKLYLATIKRQMENVSRGTTQDNLSLEKLLRFKVPTPPSKVLSAFHEVVSPIFDNVLSLAKKNEILRTTRDLLLPKLISGKLDVEDLDIDVGKPIDFLEEATA